MFQKSSHQQSVIWLKSVCYFIIKYLAASNTMYCNYRESYEIGRGCANVGAIKQARTLRLLANAFLEWDSNAHWQKALNAIGRYYYAHTIRSAEQHT